MGGKGRGKMYELKTRGLEARFFGGTATKKDSDSEASRGPMSISSVGSSDLQISNTVDAGTKREKMQPLKEGSKKTVRLPFHFFKGSSNVVDNIHYAFRFKPSRTLSNPVPKKLAQGDLANLTIPNPPTLQLRRYNF